MNITTVSYFIDRSMRYLIFYTLAAVKSKVDYVKKYQKNSPTNL